jgi:hypothetical protein
MERGQRINNGHKVALKYVHGAGRAPNDTEMVDVRPDLAETVRYVDELLTKIGSLEAQVARFENERTAQSACARIEIVAKKREEITGPSDICGQVMRISHKPGATDPDLYVMCMMPGMPICGGKCMHHARASPPPPATSYVGAASRASATIGEKK